jgi:prolyl oligopeptidase
MSLIASLAGATVLSALVLSMVPTTSPAGSLRRDALEDDFHGTKVPDPFRWLEQPDAPDTQAFIVANNARFEQFVDSPLREELRQRISELLDYPRLSAPSKRGSRYVFSRNAGLQNQSVVHIADAVAGTLDPAARVLFDPNTLSDDGTVALGGTSWTEDGSLVAYELATGGSDESIVRIRNAATGKDLSDELPLGRIYLGGWLPDNSGFFYTRFPARGSVPPGQESLNARIYLHKLGTPPGQDPVVHAPHDPELSPSAGVTEDGKYLVVYERRGTARQTRVWVRAIGDTGPLIPLATKEDASYSVVANDGGVFYVETDHSAPRGRIVAIDASNPDPAAWRELVPQADDAIDSVAVVADRFVVTYLRDAYHVVKLHGLDGRFEREIALPTVGTAYFSAANRSDREVFLTFTSFTYPSTSFRYDFASHALEEHYASPVKFEPDDYEAKQVFATSRDGTRVPMFVVHRKGLVLDGTNPTLLYGYGGFNVSMSPGFSASLIPWLERGGVYAMAVLRGGGEYGQSWHVAGQLDRKQNVFDDFIACAEKLVADGYTSPRHLAVRGGSNGGLLTAAVMLQRPELFGAIVSQVPVIDMFRYHRMGVGRFWVPEYGNAENPEHFAFLARYSPLHNVRAGVDYPPVLITTAEGDDRVVPAHAFKFAATLQATSTSPHPVLLRTETKAGHGGGKPIRKVIEETADVYAFLFKTIGKR